MKGPDSRRVAALLAVSLFASATSAQASALRIDCVRVFDGEQVVPEATVEIVDGRIAAIEPGCRTGHDGEALDGRGKTLLPGLIDAHVHVWGEARRDALRFGVTTALDMFADPAGLAAARAERETIAATDQADLWSAGILATASGGHGTQFGMTIPTLASPEDAPAWVAARKAEGSDYIKLVREDFTLYGRSRPGPTLDAATARAVIQAAHEAGLRAVAHVSLQTQAMESVRDGVDGLVHLFHDAPVSGDFVSLAREKGIFIVPTLSVLAGISGRSPGVLEDERILALLSPVQRQSLEMRFGATEDRFAMLLEGVGRLHAAGVPILAGSDAPNPGTAHGPAMHEELAHLVDAGLNPVEALAAATSVPARVFGLSDRGRIAPGLRADLVLVEGQPDVDITATRAIVSVWKNGHAVRREPPVAASAPAGIPVIEAGLLSHFDTAEADHRQGLGWVVASDGMMGGASEAAIRRVEGGAVGSAGALEISGRIAAGAEQPWAGVNFFPGAAPMAPADFSARSALVFQARGDGRSYQAMLFVAGGSAPGTATFTAGPEWSEVRLPLTQFGDIDLGKIGALAIVAGLPEGAFSLLIDQVVVE